MFDASPTVNTPPRRAQNRSVSPIRQLTIDVVSAVRKGAWPARMPKLPLAVLGAQTIDFLVHNDGQGGDRSATSCRSLFGVRGRCPPCSAHLERADHVERTFSPIVRLTIKNCTAPRKRVSERNAGTGNPGKCLCHHEGLRQEPL